MGSAGLTVADAAVREGRLRSHERHVARVAKAIERWQQRGLADAHLDTEAIAAALVAMLSGVAQWMYLRGDAIHEERALAALNAACPQAQRDAEAAVNLDRRRSDTNWRSSWIESCAPFSGNPRTTGVPSC